MKKIILLIALWVIACIAISPVAASINVSVDKISSSYISWAWSDSISVTNVSIDGYQVVLADKNAHSFILSDLKPLEQHKIIVYSANDSGYSLANTTAESSVANDIMGFFWYFIFFIAGLACLVIGLKEPLIAFGAFIFGVMGILFSIQNSFYLTALYGILIIASFFVAFRD